jgi:hypothetical protein
MARKKADTSPVRLAVDNAELVSPPAADDGGAGDARSSGRPPPPALPPQCPVVPIGTGEGVRYYLNGNRQLVTLAVKEHTRLQIMGLFGEDADMVHDIWPRKKSVTNKAGNTEDIITGWRPEDAAEQLLRLTAAKGIWSPSEKARGRGCWLAEDGSLIVNAGTAVLVDGSWQPPGLFGDYVFVAREGIMRPIPTAEPGGTSGAASEVLALLQTWNWRRPIDARLLLGLMVCAFYGAALAIRPVGWLIGPRNTGKSTLQTAIAGVAGGWLMSVIDPTPASIWQTLKHDALAIGIDEAEVDEDKDNRRRLNELVRLARLCFSGGKLPRGGSDGEATEYTLRSAVLFSSINPPPLLPQDRSRIIMMRLAKLPADQQLPDVSPQRLRALGARLLRRAIDGWPRLAAAMEQYRIALKAVGHEGRSVEIFGTALAVADIVLSDHPVDTDSAAELAQQLDFASLPEAEDDLSDEAAWLNRLLKTVIPLDGVGGRNSIHAWLRQAVTGEQTPGLSLGDIDAVKHEADRVLGYYGLKVIRARDGSPIDYFGVANRGPGLERLHADTHWAGRSGAMGGWKAAARNLDGAHETTQRFGGPSEKGTAIPLRLVFPDGYKGDTPAPARHTMPAEGDQ